MRFFLVIFFIFYGCLFFPKVAFAKVEVAFLEVRKWDGTLLQLEPNGRYAHVAIRVEGQWLQAHPQRGVELTNNFADIGKIAAILVNTEAPNILRKDIQKFVGLPYDHKFNWADTHTSYCSKLVGQILGIPPRPMIFEGPAWAGQIDLPEGAPGLSPDGLFRDLLDRGYQRTSNCADCE